MKWRSGPAVAAHRKINGEAGSVKQWSYLRGFWWLFMSDSVKYMLTKVRYNWLHRYQQHTFALFTITIIEVRSVHLLLTE